MKASSKHIVKKLLFICGCFLLKVSSFGQGYVVINEYMPWTNNGCGTTAEYIELMNFGPGPMDISCYILTEGDYTITIPPNTILQPGQYYVVAGQNSIPVGCANVDSAIQVNLNWNTCNCASAPIPTTGDGLFTDGGSASEQLVLLNPDLVVVDAVVRDMPLESSSTITTALIGNCSPRTFNLDQMTISYEVIGESAGRGNAFAREIDGDCKWVKETAQSGGATNNKPGDNPSVTYSLYYTSSRNCNGAYGSISIQVQASSNTATFPMNYILAYDVNNDNVFDLSDQYTYGTDATSPNIEIGNLTEGRYRILVSTVNGCSLKSFDFAILDCIGLLPVKLVYFKHLKTEQQKQFFEWRLDAIENVQSMVLEQSRDNINFSAAYQLSVHGGVTGSKVISTAIPVSYNKYFRLRVLSTKGETYYSAVINTNTSVHYTTSQNKLWPNPAQGNLHVELHSDYSEVTLYQVYDASGKIMLNGRVQVNKGENRYTIPVGSLKSGLYHIYVSGQNGGSLFNGKFVKQ